MIRARYAAAATLAGVSFAAVTVMAQTTQAPPMTSILAGKKFTPPVKGAAEIDYVKSPAKREGTTIITKLIVKNTSAAPIGRLKVSETWYDKDGNMIPGGDAVINGLLQPGEIATMEIKTPVNPKMAQSMMQFSHANGTVPKPHAVKSLDAPAPKEPAAKTAANTKAPARPAKKK